MVIGVMLLYRISKRRGMISSDLAQKDNISLDGGTDENESLLSIPKNPTYKGGVGAEILHVPLEYKNSYVLTEFNDLINEYNRQAEYIMSFLFVVSGLLTLLLEKHNFKSFDDHYKVPIYMCIGASLSFVIIYAIFDFIEIFKTMYHEWFMRRSHSTYEPAILTNLLYLTMIVMGCFMGGGLGIVYGITDVEGLFSQSMRLVYFETFSEIMSMAPIGLLIGLSFGFFFGILRALESHFRGELPAESEK